MKIKIVYANTKTYSGVRAYTMNLYSDISKSLNVKLHMIRRIESNKKRKNLVERKLRMYCQYSNILWRMRKRELN